jgi:cell division septal protein FtsQ
VVPSRLTRPGWIGLGAIGLALLLWFVAPRLLRKLDFFRVRRVELVGVRYLAPDVITDQIRIPDRLSLFDNLDPIRKRAVRVAGTDRVEIVRRFPGTLRIVVDELAPVALLPRNGKLVMMDSAGRILPFDAAVGAPDLPIADAATAPVAGLLGRVRDADPALFARIQSARGGPNAVELDLGGQILLFRPEASVEVIRTVMLVAQDCARTKRPWRELDGRFAGMVIVRRVAA